MKDFKEAISSSLGYGEGTFVYSIIGLSSNDHAEDDETHFAVIASDDSLTCFYVTPKAIKVVQRIDNVHQGVTCIDRMDGRKEDESIVFTGGRDGRLHCWSRKRKLNPSHGFRTPKEEGISALACCRDSDLIAAGTELESQGPGDVAVYIWNVYQTHPQPIRQYVESHTDTITRMIFHSDGAWPPLISSSTDGLVNLFNTDAEDEDDALVSVANNKSAVQHFGLRTTYRNGAHSRTVCVISGDEQVALYSLDEESTNDPEEKPWDLRQRFSCDYAISLRKAETGFMLAVGTNKSETTNSPHVDILTCEDDEVVAGNDGPNFTPAIRLHGAHGEEVVRDTWFVQDAPFILTCGEDGMVRVWKESKGSSGASVEAMEGVEQSSSKNEKRTRRKGDQEKNEKKRFKPC